MKDTKAHTRFKFIGLLSLFVLTWLTLSAMWPAISSAQGFPFDIDKATAPANISVSLQIIFLLTILSLAPSILIMMTAFTRIIVVFSFLRHAMGTQQMPPNQLLIGIALFLTLFIMAPVWDQVNTEALQPYLNEEISQSEAMAVGMGPIRNFMLKHTREKDLALFVHLAKMEKPKNSDEIPARIIIPAFVISELRISFQIGFLLYLPFIVLDMIVASLLMSMGMLMLPPIMISLPFKILMFVLVDGWYLLIDSLMGGFR